MFCRTRRVRLGMSSPLIASPMIRCWLQRAATILVPHASARNFTRADVRSERLSDAPAGRRTLEQPALRAARAAGGRLRRCREADVLEAGRRGDAAARRARDEADLE